MPSSLAEKENQTGALDLSIPRSCKRFVQVAGVMDELAVSPTDGPVYATIHHPAPSNETFFCTEETNSLKYFTSCSLHLIVSLSFCRLSVCSLFSVVPQEGLPELLGVQMLTPFSY